MMLNASVICGRGLRIVVALCFTGSVIAGCASTGTQTSGSGAGVGALLGAAAGGLIGNQVGGARGAVIGALAGGLAGGLIGDAIERAEIERQQREAIASGRAQSKRITNDSGQQVTVRTAVKTVPKADGSGLSCREIRSQLGDKDAGAVTKCQVRQGGPYSADA